MLPIGTIGFYIAGIYILAFACIFFLLTQKLKLKELVPFSLAFLFLGVMFFIWGFALAWGQQAFLVISILFSNQLFMIATLLCFSIIIAHRKNKDAWLIAAGILAIAYVFVRPYLFPVKSYVSDGLLVFNSPPVIAFLLLAVGIVVWIPAANRVANHLGHAVRSPELATFFSATVIMSYISILIIIATTSPVILILTFFLFLLSFTLLTGTTLTFFRLAENKKHG